MLSSRVRQDRKKTFKKGFDAADTKQKRADKTFEFSKSKRDENLMKKRRDFGAEEAPAAAAAAFAAEGSLEQRLQNLPTLVQGVMSEDFTQQLECTTQFRRLLSIERNPPIDNVISTGVVPRFIQFLQLNDSPKLQFEAAWAVTNIASGTADHTRVVIENGAVPIFVQLLLSPNADVREQAVWALGNIAGDSPTCRDYVLQTGAMPALLRIISENPSLTMLRNSTWALSNLCRGKPQPAFDMVAPALPVLAQLVQSPDEEVLTDACWALSYLSDGTNDKIQAVINAGVGPRLIELLLHSAPSIQTPALRAVGNIVTGDDSQTQFIVDSSALPALHHLLGHTKKGIRKEAVWALSNITAGTSGQIQSVIEANIIPPLVNLMCNAEFEVKKEAAWAISNATTNGVPEHIRYLVQQGSLQGLVDLLDFQDPKIVIVALEAIQNILKVDNSYCDIVEEADGVEKIDKLQMHENQKIYEISVAILETYFNGEEEEDEDESLVPNADYRGFQFGVTNAVPEGGFNFFGAGAAMQ